MNVDLMSKEESLLDVRFSLIKNQKYIKKRILVEEAVVLKHICCYLLWHCMERGIEGIVIKVTAKLYYHITNIVLT